jgi:protein gp37
MIFVNSMSDLFHKEIPRAHIAAVFDTMEKADWHVYQVLTKRPALNRVRKIDTLNLALGCASLRAATPTRR